MDIKKSEDIGYREDVTYPFKAGLDPRDQGGNQLTGEKNSQGESIVPVPSERPSTGKLSRFPGEVQRKGVYRK